MVDRITRGVLATAFSLGFVAIASAEADAQVAEPAAASPEVTIELEGAGLAATASGEAVMEASGEQTQVVIDLAGAPADGALQGFLVAGRCGESEDVIAELGALEADEDGKGTLRAVVPVDLETITSTPISVEVRQAQLAVACGEHLAMATEVEAGPAPAADSPAFPGPVSPEPAAPAPAEDPASDLETILAPAQP